jgi:hypothetical protein
MTKSKIVFEGIFWPPKAPNVPNPKKRYKPKRPENPLVLAIFKKSRKNLKYRKVFLKVITLFYNMEWFERYGWSTSPFVIDHMPDSISGFDDIRKKLLDFIKSGDCCLLSGPSGSGKTLLLKWIESIGTPGTDYVYINDTRNLDLDRRIREKSSFSLKKKAVVVLVDDAQSLSKELGDSLKMHFDNKTIDSIVLASETEQLSSLRESLLGEIGERIIRMRPLTIDEATGMIINRVRHINPFETGGLELIFKKAGMRPRKILELCELAAEKCTERIISNSFVVTFLDDVDGMRHRSVFENLSPLQRDIVNILRTGDFRPVDIAVRLNKPSKTITSQLAYLGLKAGIETMKRKGMEQPLVEKISERPVLYRLKEIY